MIAGIEDIKAIIFQCRDKNCKVRTIDRAYPEDRVLSAIAMGSKSTASLIFRLRLEAIGSPIWTR
jgi:hypothetical protein